MLAMVWGQVKQNPSMDWDKIKKVVETMNNRNLITYLLSDPGPVPEEEPDQLWPR